MARARMIKPSFFTNEDLPELEPYTRLLFIGLWTIADREGRLEDRPRKIKAEIFPYETLDIDTMLSNLGRKGFIHRYTVDESRYIQVVNFLKHQRPHHNESESNIPERPQDFPRSEGLATKDESASALNIDALTLNIDALDGEEPAQAPEPAPSEPIKTDPPDDPENKGTRKPTKPRKQPETFCPETFPLEEKHIKYGTEKGLTRAELERETEKFLLWHGSKQTTYADWYKAWQNWIIRAAQDKEKITPIHRPASDDPLDPYRRKLERLKRREFNGLEVGKYNGFGGDRSYQDDIERLEQIIASGKVPA